MAQVARRPTYWALLYLIVVVYRLYLCAQPPQESSDLFRQLGWASHLFERGLALYYNIPSDFAPEYWTRFWTHQHYVYPPGVLLFFAPFSAIGLGLFFVKAVLTLLDFATALLVWRMIGPFCGLLMLSAPAAMWYTSHEGQYDAVLNLCLVATVFFIGRKRWVEGGATWALALQLKHFAVLLVPFFIAEVLTLANAKRHGAALRLSCGWLFATLLFVPFYLVAPDIWLRPLNMQSVRYNPFHWNVLDPSHYAWNPPWLVVWNGAFTYTILICLIGYVVRQASIIKLLRALPVFTFWSLLKTLNWGQFWYVNSAPGLTVPLRTERKLSIILFALYWLQCGRSIALLAGPLFGYVEAQDVINHFEACLWMCNYRG